MVSQPLLASPSSDHYPSVMHHGTLQSEVVAASLNKLYLKDLVSIKEYGGVGVVVSLILRALFH
jgi:hypothetical protein